jgi:hypothetical protein
MILYLYEDYWPSIGLRSLLVVEIQALEISVELVWIREKSIFLRKNAIKRPFSGKIVHRSSEGSEGDPKPKFEAYRVSPA